MVKRKSAHSVDLYIGQRFQAAREAKNIAQEDIANALCLPLQVVQDFETGRTPIGALHLYEAAQILEVPIAYFFEGYQKVAPEHVASNAGNSPGPAYKSSRTID